MKRLRSIIAVLLSPLIFAESEIPKYCKNTHRNVITKINQTESHPQIVCNEEDRRRFKFNNMADLATSLEKIRSESLSPEYTNDLLARLRNESIKNLLARRFRALNLFPETLNIRKNITKGSTRYEGIDCAVRRGLDPNKKAEELGEFNSGENAKDLSRGTAKEMKTQAQREDLFFSKHLQVALIAKPWLDKYKDIKKTYQLKIETLSKRYKRSRYCIHNYKDKTCQKSALKGKNQEIKNQKIIKDLTYSMNKRLGPLNEMIKSYPALFQHTKTKVGLIPDLLPSGLMEKMIKKVEQSPSKNIFSKLFSKNKTKLYKTSTKKSQKFFERHKYSEDIDKMRKVGPQDFAGIFTLEDNKKIAQIASTFKSYPAIRKDAIYALKLHADILDEGARALCETEHLFGKAKDPLIHQQLNFVKNYFSQMEKNLTAQESPSESDVMEYIRLKSAHCSLLEEFPDERGISTSALTGLGLLVGGAIAYISPWTGIVASTLAISGIGAGGTILAVEGFEDYFISADKANISRGLAHEKWADWSQYDRAYIEHVGNRNINAAISVADIAFFGFDLGAIRHLSKGMKTRSQYANDLEESGDNSELWKKVSGKLGPEQIIDLEQFLKSSSKIDRERILDKLSKLEKNKERKEFISSLKLNKPLQKLGIPKETIGALTLKQKKYAIQAGDNVSSNKLANKAVSKMRSEKLTPPESPVFLVGMDKKEYTTIQSKYFRDIYANPAIGVGDPEEYDLAIQILHILEKKNPTSSSEEISSKFSKEIGIACKV